MRRILAGTLFMALAGTLSIAAPRQDHDDHHDNGKHKGWDKHEDRGDNGDRHDSGKHKGWYKQADRDDHRDWDDDHDRIRPGRPYPYGRYGHVRDVFSSRRIDFRLRRVVLYDNSNCLVVSFDLDRFLHYEWDRDRVY